jgi:hypothetical protein
VFTFAVNSSDRVLGHLKTEARFEFAAGERGGTTVRSQRANEPIENQREKLFLTSSEAGAMSGRDGISDHRGGARRLLNEMNPWPLRTCWRAEIAFARRILNRHSNEEVRYGVYGYQSECMGG